MEILQSQVLYAIKNLNVREVLLLGGEPTLYPGLAEAIKFLDSQGLDKIIITTNGIRLANDPDYMRKIFKAGLTHLNISFMNIDREKQAEITHKTPPLDINALHAIYDMANAYSVKVRINNNIWIGNNDEIDEMWKFYLGVRHYCDSVKFSPLLPTDAFSVMDVTTDWVREHILPQEEAATLFYEFERDVCEGEGTCLIENPLQFGFVKNTMIPLEIPIIMNWNIEGYTGMMEKVVNHNQINNLKLLSNGELSLSWNREDDKYFIKTK